MELMQDDEELFLTQNCFPQEVLEQILAWEGQTDPQKTSADRTMIAVVDNEELEKRKASRIPQNTRVSTSWAVCVWSE